MQPLPKLISIKFRFWAFACILMVVFIHAYNLNQRYLQPWTTPGEPLTPTSFTEYFFSNGIFRFVIPMLFIISGYLHAMHDAEPYKQRIKKRLRVLLIPYIIWSAAGLAFVYVLESFPSTKQLVESSGIMQISSTHLLLHDYYWYEVLLKWILVPVPYQLWFIRVLIIYNLFYPALRWCVVHKMARWIFFSAAVLLWLGTVNVLLADGEGLLFFPLGILLQKTDFNIEKPLRLLQPAAWTIAFVLLCAVKTWLAFNGFALMGNAVYPLLTILYKASVTCGLISVWYGSNRIALWCMHRQWFVWLTSFSFIMYAMHAPAVAICINRVFALLQYNYGYRLITYIILPVALIVIIIALGTFLRRFTPRFYALATGARG